MNGFLLRKFNLWPISIKRNDIQSVFPKQNVFLKNGDKFRIHRFYDILNKSSTFDLIVNININSKLLITDNMMKMEDMPCGPLKYKSILDNYEFQSRMFLTLISTANQKVSSIITRYFKILINPLLSANTFILFYSFVVSLSVIRSCVWPVYIYMSQNKRLFLSSNKMVINQFSKLIVSLLWHLIYEYIFIITLWCKVIIKMYILNVKLYFEWVYRYTLLAIFSSMCRWRWNSEENIQNHPQYFGIRFTFLCTILETNNFFL